MPKQRFMTRLAVRLTLLAAVLVALGWGLQRLADPRAAVAPAVAFKTIDGRELTLADYTREARPVLVTFWASTCVPCIRKLPALEALYREFAGQGLELIAVAMPYDRPDRVLRFAREMAMPYPVALDLRGTVTGAFGDVAVTPTTFLVAPDGRILLHSEGELDIQHLRERLLSILPAV